MIVEVAVPFRVFSNFSYLVPDEWSPRLKPGAIVKVPLRGKSTFGFVVSIEQPQQAPAYKLKAAETLLVEEPVFDEKMLKLFQWIAEYYCHPLGEVISTAIPKDYWQEKVVKRKRKVTNPIAPDVQPTVSPILSDEQQKAVATILTESAQKPFLLQGVTGSGKTEVYMNVLEKTLHEGKGAIVLVPEIALTPQLMNRFLARFPGRVALLHSDLTPRERFDQWSLIRRGEVSIVIGARSAVFSPIKNLGVIVVDEEHEPTYKQEESLRYNARDIAVVRGSFEGAKVILGSATPSLESYHHARNGKYHYLELKKRISDRKLPVPTLIDMRDKSLWYSMKHPWLSQPLINKLNGVIAEKQQAILFLNRLGFSQFLFCDDCGFTWRCNNCDVSLTYYQNPPHMKCHYCGTERVVPNICEKCNGISIQKVGLGTEQVQSHLEQIFPSARITRFDRSMIKNRKQLEHTIKAIHSKEHDIIIGTQMLAKGHDFPDVSLVGILMADASLNFPDIRAGERTFQMITQVSGRAGRAEIPGQVIVQTVNPENPIIELATQNRIEEFYLRELQLRKSFYFPPFCRLAMLRFQSPQEFKVKQFAQAICQDVGRIPDFKKNGELLGPTEAPLSRLKGMYRWQALLKSNSSQLLHQWLVWLQENAEKRKSPVKFAVDVDPVHAL